LHTIPDLPDIPTDHRGRYFRSLFVLHDFASLGYQEDVGAYLYEYGEQTLMLVFNQGRQSHIPSLLTTVMFYGQKVFKVGFLTLSLQWGAHFISKK